MSCDLIDLYKSFLEEAAAANLKLTEHEIKEINKIINGENMNFNQYQETAMTTCKEESKNLEYMVLGLASEAGEVAGKLKKKIRDGEKIDFKESMIAEVGDCLWYCAGIMSVLGISLEVAAEYNVSKLLSRKKRGKIEGSGDNR